MKNLRTPRTLAESTFVVDYPLAHFRRNLEPDRWVAWLLAIAIGVALGAVLAYGG